MFGSSWMETSPENEVICPDVKQVGKGTKKVNPCPWAVLGRAVGWAGMGCWM